MVTAGANGVGGGQRAAAAARARVHQHAGRHLQQQQDVEFGEDDGHDVDGDLALLRYAPAAAGEGADDGAAAAGGSALRREIAFLKRDRQLMTVELGKLRQSQSALQTEVSQLRSRLQGTEARVTSFLRHSDAVEAIASWAAHGDGDIGTGARADGGGQDNHDTPPGSKRGRIRSVGHELAEMYGDGNGAAAVI